MKRWILVDFDSCPECGDNPEILTSSKEENVFYDSDEVRCCQKCGAVGYFSTDGEEDGYINWCDESKSEKEIV